MAGCKKDRSEWDDGDDWEYHAGYSQDIGIYMYHFSFHLSFSTDEQNRM